MLTKTDIDLIRKVVRQEVGNESQVIRDDLGGEMRVSNLHLRDEIGQVANRLKNLEIRTTQMNADVKKVITDIAQVNKQVKKTRRDLKEDIKQISDSLDKDSMRTRKRVTRLETHLGLVA